MSAPLVRFVVGGVQKAGTSALAHYLGKHAGLRLPDRKEAHVFDDPGFDERWTTADIDARFKTLLPADAPAYVCGDATPIYLFAPPVVARIARYNPAMRWIVILRDPVDRAISHYHMEKGRGQERLPLTLALLLERWRLRGHAEDLAWSSPLRTHSYLARGDYTTQLQRLLRHFPRRQVLLLRTDALRRDPQSCLARIWSFLDVPPPEVPASPAEVFPGDYERPGRHSLPRLVARWRLRHELERMRSAFGLGWDG